MNIYNKRLALAVALAAGFIAEGAAAVPFADASKLADGKWVKIRTGQAGIYEISYSRLREMGFSDPSKVGVYGTGTSMRPDNFLNSSGERLYADDLPALTTFHHNDKIYFYGKGPETISLNVERVDEKAPYFSRSSRNIYSANGYYFLAENRSDARFVEPVEKIMPEEDGDEFYVYDYIYHEKDLQQNYNESGQLFFGESFRTADSRTLNIPFSTPLADLSEPVSLECVFMHNNSTAGSTLTYGFGTTAAQRVSATLGSVDNGNYYTYAVASPTNGMVTMPATEGNIAVTYTPKGTPSGANLDYVLAGYKRRPGYQNNESQCRGYISPDGLEAGIYRMASAPDDALVWRVDANGNLEPIMATTSVEGGVNITLGDKLAGGDVIVSFSPSREQLQPDAWSEVANQNLHATPGANMVIITLPQYKEYAKELAQLNKEYDGSEVVYACPTEIYNEFSEGMPDPMAYRTFVKMVYDKSGGKLKNVLLLGDQRSDMLQADKPARTDDAIITYQTLESNKSDSTFGVNDIHGMMEDYEPTSRSGQNLHLRQMQLGVASMPVRDEAECRLMLDKLARYMADDSFVYWMNDNIYLADTGDKDMHSQYTDDIATRVANYTGNTVTPNKIYANDYVKGLAGGYFHSAFNRGGMFTLYFGHGGTGGFSHYLSGTDVDHLKNTRLGFMAVAGCEISGFDRARRGVPEKLLLASPNGLIGALLSTRTAWASQNKMYMNHFTMAMYQDSERKKGPRTIGEIYARSKSTSTANNEFVYHLMGYPGLRYPVATENCNITKADGDGVEKSAEGEYTFKAGRDVKISGEVRGLDGTLRENYNGRIVAKVYDAPRQAPLAHLVTTSDQTDVITYDNKLLGMSEATVKNGKFEIMVGVPASVSAEGKPSIRLTAYDKSERRGAAGYFSFGVDNSGVTSGKDVDTAAPVIEAFSVSGNELTSASPIFHVEVTDDRGVRLGASDLNGSTQFLLDGRIMANDLSGYCEATDGGKKVRLTIPVEEISTGRHTARIDVRDYSGNMASSSLEFTVGDPGVVAGELKMAEVALFDKATFEYSSPEVPSQARLYVLDGSGNTVFSSTLTGLKATWNGNNAEGKRVTQGIYTAYVSGKTADGCVFVSPRTEFAVFDSKK